MAVMVHSSNMLFKNMPKVDDLEVLEKALNEIALEYGENDPAVANMREHIRLAKTMRALQKATSGLLQTFEAVNINTVDFENPEAQKPIVH